MKKVALLFIGSVCASLAFAQTTTAIALPDSPQSRFTMGFNVGSTYNIYQWNSSPYYYQYQFSDKICDNLGVKFGIITEYKFSKHFSFAPKIELAFSSSNYSITNAVGYWELYKTKTNNIAIDLVGHVKLKAQKMYVIVGPSLKIPMKIGDLNEDNITLPGADIGIGFERKFKTFVIAPELRYTGGLSSFLEYQRGNLSYHNISLLINFSGL